MISRKEINLTLSADLEKNTSFPFVTILAFKNFFLAITFDIMTQYHFDILTSSYDMFDEIRVSDNTYRFTQFFSRIRDHSQVDRVDFSLHWTLLKDLAAVQIMVGPP